MNFHPDSSPTRQYILENYPQFVEPIESIQWQDWDENTAVPDGKNLISLGFYVISLFLAKTDGEITAPELDFFRDIESLFEERNDAKTKSADLVKIYHDNYDQHLSLFSVPALPAALLYLDIYDNAHGTKLGDKARTMYFRYGNAMLKADGKITAEETAKLEKLKEVFFPSVPPKEETVNNTTLPDLKAEDIKPLDELIAELHALVGLDNIKNDVQELVNFLKVQQIRQDKGMATIPISRHLVFYGNPGTGKTTIARLLAKIYRSLNIISKGHLVETDRSGLVAGYIGQTALKVQNTVNKALGGVLFIDEAYALHGSGQDFGAEAIETLLKLMEDHRDDLIVIVAGYTDKMTTFLSSNPGFRSRFNKYFSFGDYSPEQLLSIFEQFCTNADFKPTDEAKEKVLGIFTSLYQNRDNTFGNARLARNLFEQAVNNQASRIISHPEITEALLTCIEASDIPEHIDLHPKM